MSCKQFAVVFTLFGLLGGSSAQAVPIGVDQIIYEEALGTVVDEGLLSGTIDIVSAGNTLTITLTNTSPDAAFLGGGAPATMLLTGFGIEIGGVDIVSGTVSVAGGSTALNFGGQGTPDISNQWLYANAAIDGYNGIPGVLPVDAVTSSVSNGGGTRFAGPPPVTIDGPDFGALSAFETEFGASTAGVQDTISLVLTLDGAAPSEASIDAGNVVLAFGSPDLLVPEPGAGLLLLVGVASLAVAGRRRS